MKRKKHPVCTMPDCWQEARAQKGGLCSACTQWWNRIALKTPTELALYITRQQRMSRRLSLFITDRSKWRTA